MPIAASSTAETLTAIGTIALAVVTLALVVTTIVITRQDRRNAENRFHNERQEARDHEQFAEARAIEVILGERDARPDEIDHLPGVSENQLRRTGQKVLTAAVINHGAHAITGIETHLFVGEMGRKVPFVFSERVTGDKARDKKLLGGATPFVGGWVDLTELSPWDNGLSLASGPMSPQNVPLSYVVVRWTDQWGTRWEYMHGRVRKV